MGKRFILRLCVVSTLLIFSLGGVGLRSQAGQAANTTSQDASVNAVAPIDPRISKYAVGDVDNDHKDEVAVDFGASGIWLYDQGNWSQIAPENPESLFAFRQSMFTSRISIVADLGSLGLWMWRSGTWRQLSAADVNSLADGLNYFGGGSDGQMVLFADFGGVGIWVMFEVYPGTWHWAQLCGETSEYVVTTRFRLSPYFGGFSTLFGDFGSLGLWGCTPWLSSTNWDQLSSENTDSLSAGREWLAADFGSLGLWQYSVFTDWAQLTGANADFVSPADINADNLDEIVVDFGSLGLWLWDSIRWNQLTDANPEFMISADVTGDGSDEIAVDLGAAGLWVWNDGPWSQISTMDPEYLLSADTNGDGAKEILADFGASGLWMWNGAWAQISEDNPD